MEHLDVKDKKIIYYLDLDARQSFSTIGKQVGLHKDVVTYRVHRLVEKGIIHFITVINEHKLGMKYLRFCLTYQYATPEIKKEIIDYFVKNKYTVAVHASEGQCDLILIFGVKNIPDFYDTWYRIFSKYRDYFSRQIFSIYCKTMEYKYTFLLDKNEQENDHRVLFNRQDDGKCSTIDELDTKLLHLLNKNARIPTITLAEKLHTTALTINHRIRKLLQSGIILGFRVALDYSKIDYRFFTVNIKLKDFTKIEKIVAYLESKPNLVGRIMILGQMDLEFLFFLKSIEEIQDIMNDLSSKFPQTIKDYTYSSHTHSYKFQYLPEIYG
jgi:Lrp/AsnC family transcriptional regulator for asnA, asnC and gidA